MAYFFVNLPESLSDRLDRPACGHEIPLGQQFTGFVDYGQICTNRADVDAEVGGDFIAVLFSGAGLARYSRAHTIF